MNNSNSESTTFRSYSVISKVTPKYVEYRYNSKRGSGRRRKPPGVPAPDDRALGMRATENTRVASNEASDAPTTVQVTYFAARNRLDDSTVVQAAENTSICRSTPIVTGTNHWLQDTETIDCAEVGR